MEYKKKRLPIGIENFEKIRTENFYYVDKTMLIRDLLENWSEVNLFTRPRRFGKSLNMSMLKSFFDRNADPSLFDGLAISEEKSLCEKYKGNFPVISLSLKGVNAACYDTAYDMAVRAVNETASHMQHLLESERLTSYDKERFRELLRSDMDEATFCSSLRELSRILEKHYGQKTVLFLDEYDVPLAKAFQQGYYDSMVFLIRNLFEQSLKTNDSLQFAVLTGCMRISKESIFTGLNNLRVLSVADVEFDAYFGFTDREVNELLKYYGLSDHASEIKNWYDGYQFGSTEVYCPWDVLCYCSKLLSDRHAQPQNFWSNTSSNEAVRRFIECSDSGTAKREIESLIAGEVIRKKIRQELTYQDMYSSIENLWSILFTTGYLTQRGKPEQNLFYLAIPNIEIREIFTEQIMELFHEDLQTNKDAANRFCAALKKGDVCEAEARFSEYLLKTISIRDTFVKKKMKENFYHGILLGLLGSQNSWDVSSNKESGDGYSDITAEIEADAIGIILEVKDTEDGNLEKSCEAALNQIDAMRYEESLREDGMQTIRKYGIACYKKRCMIRQRKSRSDREKA